jgi:hypothetical protein
VFEDVEKSAKFVYDDLYCSSDLCDAEVLFESRM